jgi:hypothetical protein
MEDIMRVGDKEFDKLVIEFEKYMKKLGSYRLDRERKDANVPAGVFYQNGNVNQMFHAFMGGYSLAKCMATLGDFE